VTSEKDTEERVKDTAESFRFRPYRPERSDKLPPCRANCPSGTAVRDWIAEIAQAPADEAGRRDAYARAWRLLVASNPFPATMGRICPHPCEADCNRSGKDGAVAINALERFLGDWAIAQNWPLPVAESASRAESIGVIGAGPAGLSFAYQMRRRGYPVTVYERHELAGGMLRYGVPDYRLPRAVLDAEVDRLLSLGVELVAPVRVGVDVSLEALQSRHRVLFLGFGAQRARRLGLAGERDPHIFNGIEFLERANEGDTPAIGDRVVVVGGGNTAIDAARVARRNGAQVTLLYRRRREDMPAIAEELEAALEEGVAMQFLTIPIALIRGDTGSLSGVRVQRMRLTGALDAGRAVAEPVPGETGLVLASSVITAVSQESDWTGFDTIADWRDDLEHDGQASIGGSILCAGGDLTGPDIASHAIGQGRAAAEQVHARLAGVECRPDLPTVEPRVDPDHYPPCERTAMPTAPVADRLADASREHFDTLSEEQFLREISRCFSCGLCNGCRLCWMYCGGNGFTRLESPGPGRYFAFSTEECTGCGKCIELCPTGFLGEAP
jgi:NADPH-dependent glutamate synthase beta subunit-like oxidoreductase/NAD-dependent dihydropyrimidine dehydrogenase PreA subunit